MPRPVFVFAGALLIGTAPSQLTAQAWRLEPTAPSVINESSALSNTAFTPLPDGRLLAYGGFTHINGTAAPGLTRLGVDGTVDPAFAAEAVTTGGRWSSVAPLGAGGYIAIVAPDVAHAYAASAIALEGATSIFGVIAPAQSITAESSRAPTVPLSLRSTLVRLRADGRRDPSFAPLACDGLPRLLPLADGRILISGTFSTLGSWLRNGLARLAADGTVDPGFAPKLADTLVAITAAVPTTSGAVIASGYTYDSRGRPAYYFSRITAGGAIDPDFAPGPVNATFSMLVPQPDGGVLAGNYTLFRYSPTGAIDFRYALRIPQLKSLVRAVPLANGRMVVEASVGPSNFYGTPAVFTISATGEVETDHRPTTGTSSAQRLLAVFPDERLLLLHAGTIISVVVANDENVSASVVAQATSAVAAATAGAPDPTAAASTLVPILAQPTLTDASLAIRHPGAGTFVPFSAALTHRRTGIITQLERDTHGRVYLVGPFTHIDGHARPGIARLRTDGSFDSGFAPEAGVSVLLLPPDGRPVVRTSSGRISRLRDDGSLDLAFTFPSGIDPNKTRWLTGTPDGRLLVSAFTPNDTSEANLRLIWLDADGTRLNTLPTRFAGFAQRYLYYVTIPVITLAPTYGSSPVTTNVDSSVVSTTTGAVTGSTGSAFATVPATSAVATIGTALGAAIPATSIPPSSTPTLITGPAVPFPSYYPYYVPNAISAARILADNRILVAGSFQTADALSRPGLVWLRADGMVDGPRPDPTTITTPVLVGPSPEPVVVTTVPAFYYPPPSLLLPDGRALVFNTQYIGYSTRVVAKRVRDDGTTDPTFTPAPGSLSTTTRALDDGSLFSGGRLFTADGQPNPNFAPQYLLNDSPLSSLNTLAVLVGDQLWVAGRFDHVDGATRNGLARFRTTEVVGITFGPRSQTVVTGRDTTFNVVLGTNRPATYRWTHDGATLPGATSATLRLADSGAAHSGAYRAIVTIAGQEFTSAPATLTLTPNTARLVNFSARSIVTPTSPQIAGIVCADVPPRTLLLRAVGRGLPNSGNAALLPTPVLTLYDGPHLLAENRGSATHPAIAELARQVGAFPIFSSAGGAALAREIGAGALTAITTSGDNGSGVSLFECYDTGSPLSPALVRNFSIRGQTAAGNGILTAGIVIGGDGPLRVLIRAIGPTLAGFGVNGAVADPILHVFASSEPAPLATNDNWSGAPETAAAAASVRAFPLAASSRDAALVLNLEPGAYTAQVVGAGGATGEALIEIYALDR